MSDMYNPVTGKRSHAADDGPSSGATHHPSVFERKAARELYKEQRNLILGVSVLVMALMIMFVLIFHMEVFTWLKREKPKEYRRPTISELKASDSSFWDFLCRGRKCR